MTARNVSVLVLVWCRRKKKGERRGGCATTTTMVTKIDARGEKRAREGKATGNGPGVERKPPNN